MKNKEINLERLNFEELYKILNNYGVKNDLIPKQNNNPLFEYEYQVSYFK